jgi:hypothetical protein
VNHASKKDIVRGRHSFCLSYLDGWQEQLQRNNISVESQISRHLTDEYCYQPKRLERIIKILGRDENLVTPTRNTRKLVGITPLLPPLLLLPPTLVVHPLLARQGIPGSWCHLRWLPPQATHCFLPLLQPPIAPSSNYFVTTFPGLPRDTQVSLSFASVPSTGKP